MAENKIINKVVKSDNLIFTFMRSAVASLSSAVADLGSRVLFFSVILVALPEFYRSNLSVAIGAIIGGVVNCVINYKFTFHAAGQNKIGIAVKFFICWAGNLLLNMYGTTLLLIHLSGLDFIKSSGISNDELFSITTFVVAILVSIFWNFTMQRYFVYRTTSFDRWIIQKYKRS